MIEQNGLHVVAVTHITPRGPTSDQSVLLFPTRFVNPHDPRGYLRTALTFPKVPRPPNRVTFDGITLTFYSEIMHQLNYALSVIVSIDEPVVHILLKFEYEQSDTSLQPSTTVVLNAGGHKVYRVDRWLDKVHFQRTFSCLHEAQTPTALHDEELRRTTIAQWTHGVKFDCEDVTLKALVHFAKIRTSEAVFNAPSLGLVHSPGGLMFYCGVWCNDQAEYAAPLFPILHPPGSLQREAMEQSLRVLYQNFDTANNQIPYSIEIDGNYVGRLDRGDSAMFALGASQYILAVDNESVSQEFFPAVSFACEIICDRISTNADGILPSQSDELEGRFSSGDANLSVNCLAILALQTAAEVAHHINDVRTSERYRKTARNLRNSVHEFFRTPTPWKYAYHRGCLDARGWICLTALAKLPDGHDALKYALTNLWKCDSGSVGVRTISTSDDVWDRCTLYAIRAAFASGVDDLIELGAKRLEEYSQNRLRSSASAPYAVENEASGAQLSAESSLVIRTFTEGLLGLTLLAGRTFSLQVACPRSWNHFHVNDMWLFGKLVSVNVVAVGKVEQERLLRVVIEMERGSVGAQLRHGDQVLVTLQLSGDYPLIELVRKSNN